MKNKILIILLGIIFVAVPLVNAQQVVNFVTYGADGNPREGDNDFKQVFFIQVNENRDEPIVVELFDANCGGNIDKVFKHKYDSKFKFSLYGGSKVYTAETTIDGIPSSSNMYKGKLLKQLIVTNEADYENNWTFFASINKREGELVNGFYYFKVIVEGLSGDDANIFNIRAVSKNKEEIRIINFAPTIHLNPRMAAIRLRFNSGENSKIKIENFDVDRAKISFLTPYRDGIKLSSSGNGNWKSNFINLLKFEKNEICAIQFGPGKKYSNDAIFQVTGEDGKLIPIQLPIMTLLEDSKPVINKVVKNVDCRTIIIDASKSFDVNDKSISAKWLLPDGTIKEKINEHITFDDAGKYSITLAVKSDSRSVRSGTYKKFNVVINQTPTASAGDNKVCSPGEKVFFNGGKSYDPDGFIKKYNWNYGDGTTGKGKKTVHKYTSPGLYKVILEVIDNSNGICDGSRDSLNVIVNNRPIAVAGDNLNASIDEIITFDASQSSDPDGKLISYNWNFGDGGREDKSKAYHTFKYPGKYKVKLIVVDNSTVKNNYATDELIVVVNEKPIAKAGGDCEIATNEKMVFDASKSRDKDGEIVEYLWSCKGEFTENKKVFSHYFKLPGKYKVKLKVKDNSGTKSDFAEDEMIVTVNAKPIAIAGDDVYQTNSVVLFDASNSTDPDGKIDKYSWSFGDGSSSELKKVKHFYKNAGKYKVILRVQDNSKATNNSSTTEKNIIINAKPIADAGADLVIAPDENFYLTAKNSMDIDGRIDSTVWSLDDKIISRSRDFNYSISKPGCYNVQLKVTDNSEHPSAIDYDNLKIIVNESPKIICDEYYEISVGKSINFDATKSFDFDGKIISYKWILDGNIISRKEKFNCKFPNAGIQKILLKVTDNSKVANSTSEKTIEVFVNNSPIIKTNTYINSCSNTVVFSAHGSYDNDGDIVSYSWDFGDSTTAHGIEARHTYSFAGSYPVTLKANDGHNLSNSISTKQIIVKINSVPIANAGVDEIICTGDIIMLDASASYDADGDLLKYEWDFGDSTTASGITVNKNYNLPGLYEVKLKVTDNSGLECNYSYDTKILQVVESPVAFAGEDIIACSGEEVFFNAFRSTDSDGIVNSFAWDFGDGTTGGGEKTSHVYKEVGVYNVHLTITGELTGECDNTDTDELVVIIEEAPLARFESVDSVALNTSINFNALSSDGRGNNITNYKWSFGDGTSATGTAAQHKYSQAGTYIVELTIETDSKAGCSTSTNKKSIYVNDKPIAIAVSNKSANVNELLLFDATKSYDPNGKITNYKWDFGDGTTKEGINVFHSFTKRGKYKVSLTVKDDTNLSNNSDTFEYTIEINSPPSGKIVIPEYGYVGKPISIKGNSVSDRDGSIKSIVWSIGEFVDSSSQNISHVFTSAGKYDILCRVTDDKNSVTEITKTIKIYSIPKLSVIAEQTVCINRATTFKSTYSSDNSEVKLKTQWELPNRKIISGNKLKTTFSTAGNNKIKVSLMDNNTILVEKEVELYVNQKPVAKIISKDVAFIGGANDNILFDASESYDPDGSLLTYLWDMGDGNKMEGAKFFYSYQKSGKYKVSLTVSDNKACSCSESKTTKIITVKNRK